MNEKAEEQMIAARLRLIRDAVFFGAGAMQLRLEESDQIPAMATNGSIILYNPEWVLSIPFKQVIGVIAHEVLHVFLLHHVRRGERDPKRWNIAGDFVINILVKDNKFELPDGALYDKKYAGMSAEEVYNLLPEDAGQGQGEGESDFGQVMDADDGDGNKLTEAQAKQEEARVKGILQNSAALARKAGTMTANLEGIVEATCIPKADWRSILRDFISAQARNDYNWAKPDKRQLHQYGIVTPSLDGLELGEIVLINDTSGSCWNDQEQFCSELSCILADYECTVHVVDFDTDVKQVRTYTSDDLPIKMSPAGGGGTDPTSAFAYVAENFNPKVIVMTTDLELSFRAVPVPECPVIIACTERSMLESGPDWATVLNIS